MAYGLVLALVLGAIVLLRKPAEVRRIPKTAMFKLLAAFVAVSAISTIAGLPRFHSLGGALSFGFELVILGAALFGFWFIRSADQLTALWTGYVLTLGVASAAVLVGLVVSGCWYQIHLAHNSALLRQVLYGWPNHLAVAFALGMVGSIALIQILKGRWRILASAGLVLSAIALFLTYSRTGYVVILAGLILLALRTRIAGRLRLDHVLIVLAVGLTLQSLTGNSLFTNASAATSSSDSGQVAGLQCQTVADIQAGAPTSVAPPAGTSFLPALLENALYSGTLTERINFVEIAVKDLDPVTWVIGSGYQNNNVVLAHHLNETVVPGLTVGEMLTTHDDYLTVLIKTGVIGLALMLAVLATLAWALRRSSMDATGKTRTLLAASYASAVVVLLACFAGEELHYWPVAAMFWLLAGASTNLIAHPKTD